MPAGIYERKHVSLVEFLRLRSVDCANGCIVWIGPKLNSGYGHCNWRGGEMGRVSTTAHRAAYINAFGWVPDGYEVDHLCKNISCINPSHLEAVTHLENVRRGIKANQTHCINGHEFTAENTYRKRSNGCRVCRQCAALRQKRRRT